MKHGHPMEVSDVGIPEEEREITKAINSVQVLREMVYEITDKARKSADNLFGPEVEKAASDDRVDCPPGDTHQLHHCLSEAREAVEMLRRQVSRLSRV